MGATGWWLLCACVLLALLASRTAAEPNSVPEQKLLSELGVDHKSATVVANDNTLLSKKSDQTNAAPSAAAPSPSPQTERVDHVTPVHERLHQMLHEGLDRQAAIMRQQLKDNHQFILEHNKDLAANTAQRVAIVRDTALKHVQHEKDLHRREEALESKHVQYEETVMQKMHDLGVEKAQKLRDYELSALDMEKQRLQMEKQLLIRWNQNQNEHLQHVADLDQKWLKLNEKKLQNTVDLNQKDEKLKEDRVGIIARHDREWKRIKHGTIDVIRQQIDDLRDNPPPEVSPADDPEKGGNVLSGPNPPPIITSGPVPYYTPGFPGPANPVPTGYGYPTPQPGGPGIIVSFVPGTSPPPCYRFRSTLRLRGLPSTSRGC